MQFQVQGIVLGEREGGILNKILCIKIHIALYNRAPSWSRFAAFPFFTLRKMIRTFEISSKWVFLLDLVDPDLSMECEENPYFRNLGGKLTIQFSEVNASSMGRKKASFQFFQFFSW